jgi:hypothetical protein
MNRHVKALTLLLAAQLAILIGVLLWQQRDVTNGGGQLLTIDRVKVDGILVEDDAGAKLKLTRAASGWQLPDAGGLPADSDKVTQLLDKLFEANAPWPVATTAASAKRFEVTPDKFQRHIQLLVGDQVTGDVYLGTSPGFRKVHARLAESDDIYAITFANFEATTKVDDWLDKALLKPAGEITSLERPGQWSLSKTGDTWALAELGAGEVTKQEAAKDIVNKVANLRVMGVGEAPADDAKPVLELIAHTAGGDSDYRFYRAQEKSDFVVARSGQPGYFRLAAYIGEPLLVERSNFVGSAEAAPRPAPEQPLPAKP